MAKTKNSLWKQWCGYLHPCLCQTVYLNVNEGKAGTNLFVFRWSLICRSQKKDDDLALLDAPIQKQDTNYLCQWSVLGTIYNQITIMESIICIYFETWTKSFLPINAITHALNEFFFSPRKIIRCNCLEINQSNRMNCQWSVVKTKEMCHTDGLDEPYPQGTFAVQYTETLRWRKQKSVYHDHQSAFKHF